MLIRLLNIIFLLLLVAQAYGQTCCTAGAPISTNLEISNADINSLSVQLSYEFKSINLLIDENTKLQNDPRSRSGQNAVLKFDYVLAKKWAVSALVPIVQQSRTTLSESQSSVGLGDISLLLQYSVYADQRNAINLSGGVKLPSGKVNHRGDSNIFLSPDMQSGSGSYDFIARASYVRTRFIVPSLVGKVSTVYRKNGVNDAFGSTDSFGGRNFGFGDQANVVVGFNYLIDYKLGFLIPDLALRYRWANSNREQQTNAPNSGGNWLSLAGGFSYDFDGKKSIRLYGEVPLYQQLVGLQITTNLIVGVQLSYLISKNKTDNLIQL